MKLGSSGLERCVVTMKCTDVSEVHTTSIIRVATWLHGATIQKTLNDSESVCEILGSHGSKYDDDNFLGYSAM
jgi:hypothetical protein